MDAIQRGLSRGIPFEKAASFFVGLKRWQPLSPEDDRLMAACVKTAAAAIAQKPELTKVADPLLRFRILAALEKTAADEEGVADGAALASPTPEAVPPEGEYLENEAAAIEAETANALRYYQEQLEAARAQAAQAQEQASAASQQVEQMTMEQQNHETQVQAAQQEGQIAQQAALQQVQTANQQAAQAMQQAVDAENRALTAKGQEASAKIQQQQVRTQLFDLASQGLPGTEPELGGEGNAAEGLAPMEEAAGGPEEAAAEGGVPAEGDPAATGAEEAPTSDQNQAGEPAGAEGMPGEEVPVEGDPAAAAPDAVQAPAPGSPPGPQAQSTGEPSAPEQDPSAKRTGQVSIKVGADIRERFRKLVADRGLDEAALEREAKTAAMDPRLMGGLAGGALGAGAAALEASGHGPDLLGKAKERVAAGEAAAQQPGLRGFGAALNLAKDRAMATLGEATQNHPVAATITGGLMGASAGASAGPRLATMLREAASLRKGP